MMRYFIVFLQLFISVEIVGAADLEAGSQIVECVNAELGFVSEGPEWDGRLAHTSARSEDQVFSMHGLLGYHPTWHMLIDQASEPPRGFETYGMVGVPKMMFSRAIPGDVIAASEACGVEYSGLWDRKPPWSDESYVHPNDAPEGTGQKWPKLILEGDLLPGD